MRTSTLLSLAALYAASSAHFILKYPETIGFSDDEEGTSPCGGFTPDFSSDKVVDFHVGGEAIALRSTHQQVTWLFRVTTDQKAKSGWEQVFPIVQQSGLGDFCEPKIVVGSSYAGKKGVVNIVSNAPDGLLYQCVAANFVTGSADAPSSCKNASSVSGSFVSDKELSALVSGNTSSTETGASSTSSATQTAASASSSDSAAVELRAGWAGGLGGVAATVAGMVVAGALLI